ncbi:MAG: hypothetical protein HY958_10935 [Bacteroidia bacterium]|nr:hypothetical protein [Bacteroidia bacterium]
MYSIRQSLNQKNQGSDNIGNNGNWWSSTENSTTNAWKRNLNYNNSNVNRNNNNKSYGFSVRCLRDLKENMPMREIPAWVFIQTENATTKII